METTNMHWSQLEFQACPFCGCEEYIHGPEGSNCINFKCWQCGARFNDMYHMGVALIAWPEMRPRDIQKLLDLESQRETGGS